MASPTTLPTLAGPTVPQVTGRFPAALQETGAFSLLPGHSLEGWAGSREARILASRRAGSYSPTQLKLSHL